MTIVCTSNPHVTMAAIIEEETRRAQKEEAEAL